MKTQYKCSCCNGVFDLVEAVASTDHECKHCGLMIAKGSLYLGSWSKYRMLHYHRECFPEANLSGQFELVGVVV